jgi:hypothetical protein
MKILCIGAVENRTNIDEQILKQTIQPDRVIFLVDETPAQGINNRRKRIAENQERLAEVVEAYQPDLVWQVEGDCELPEDCLERLLGRYIQLQDDNFGYISGIQVGRHGLYHIGAWHMYDDSFESIDPNAKGIVEVDATGFYCLLAPIKVWLKGRATWNGEPYGPDVTWGLSLEETKYVDMGLEIGHKIKGGVIMPSDMSTTQAHFFKTNKGWEYKTT